MGMLYQQVLPLA
jgi:hypothetical protein